jgi:hypothetical protein
LNLQGLGLLTEPQSQMAMNHVETTALIIAAFSSFFGNLLV